MSGDDTLRDSKRTIIGLGIGPGTAATIVGAGPRAAGDPGELAAAAHDDLIGQLVIGRYIVEERLGSGAFGAVYRGHHGKLRRPVAIKVLHPHLVHQPQILQRFRREAQLAARLAHRNVAGVLDVGETPDGRQLMVLDLAVGQPLTALLGEPLPRARVIGLVRQLLLGLEHAHAAGSSTATSSPTTSSSSSAPTAPRSRGSSTSGSPSCASATAGPARAGSPRPAR